MVNHCQHAPAKLFLPPGHVALLGEAIVQRDERRAIELRALGRLVVAALVDLNALETRKKIKECK